jgi:FkbM family methyltransferase
MIQVCRDWPRWFGEYFGGINDGRPMRYRMRMGAVLNTRRNRSDLHMIDENWAFRKYEYFGYEVRPGDVVVDIGANIGSFAVYAAAARRAGRVIAFEPHPGNFSLLSRNVEENGLGQVVTCVNEAVSGSPGQVLLLEDAGNFGGHSLAATGLASAETATAFKVRCGTLEETFERFGLTRIDYLKIDCEGAEYEILEATPESIFRRIGRVSMEYHRRPGRRVEELGEILERYGFRVRYYDGHRIYAGCGG